MHVIKKDQCNLLLSFEYFRHNVNANQNNFSEAKNVHNNKLSFIDMFFSLFFGIKEKQADFIFLYLPTFG